MPKRSSVDRIVGNADDSVKKKVSTELKRRFEDQSDTRRRFGEAEVPKSPETIALIALANDATNHVLEDYGLPALTVPADNVHILDSEYSQDEAAHAHVFDQSITIPEQPARTLLFENLVHEMFHFKSYHAVQIDRDRPSREYREGIRIEQRKRPRTLLNAINEAVVEELTIRAMRPLLTSEHFRAERERTLDLIHSEVYQDTGQRIIPAEEEADVAFANTENGGEQLAVYRYSYPKERELLRLVLHALHEARPGDFPTVDAAFHLFVRALFTGDLLRLGKLIEKVERGHFYRLAAPEISVEQKIEYLRARRRPQTPQ